MDPSKIAEAMREAAAKTIEVKFPPTVPNESVDGTYYDHQMYPSEDIIAAIRALPIPAYSEWVLVPKVDEEHLNVIQHSLRDGRELKLTERVLLSGLLSAMIAAKEASRD